MVGTKAQPSRNSTKTVKSTVESSRAVALPAHDSRPPGNLIDLHAKIGNRAVGQLLGAGGGAAASVLETLSRPGWPLDPSLKRAMEARIGADLSAVRLHTDGASADSARNIQAKAYATGNHVVFSAGRFDPETLEGSRLLTHELTHVVQQGVNTFPAPAAALAAPTMHPAGSPAELEASSRAISPVSGPPSHSVPVGALMREPEGEPKQEESKGVFETIVGGLIGDFNNDPTLAEIGINTGVGLIPVVGEVTAARDVTANIYFMETKKEYTSPLRWMNLVFALISLFPEIGAALKGLGKTLLKGATEAVGPIIRLIENVMVKLGHSEGLLGFFRKNWGKVVVGGMALFEKVMAKLSSLLTRGVRFISSRAEAFARGLESIKQAAMKFLPEAIEKARGMIEGVLEKFGLGGEKSVAKGLGEGSERAGSSLEKQVGTGKLPDASGKRWEDFLPEAKKRLEAAKKEYGDTGIVAKLIDLPSWKKLTVDWVHISERHMVGGINTQGRTIFTGLNRRQVERVIRGAYEGNAKKLATQGERVLIRGTFENWTVEMWVNTQTKLLETAYPIF